MWYHGNGSFFIVFVSSLARYWWLYESGGRMGRFRPCTGHERVLTTKSQIRVMQLLSQGALISLKAQSTQALCSHGSTPRHGKRTPRKSRTRRRTTKHTNTPHPRIKRRHVLNTKRKPHISHRQNRNHNSTTQGKRQGVITLT